MSKFILILFLPMVLSEPYRCMHSPLYELKEIDIQPSKSALSNQNINEVETMEPLNIQRRNSAVNINIFMSGKAPTCSCDSKTHHKKEMKKPKRDDYQYTPGIGTHKLHTVAQDFHTARKTCNKEGGHLAVVNSREEEMVLMELFNRSRNIENTIYERTHQAYIGIHDLFEEGEWLTILGDPLSAIGYINWSRTWCNQTQPDNLYDQNCGSLLREGGMDDINCDWAYPFFCELPSL